MATLIQVKPILTSGQHHVYEFELPWTLWTASPRTFFRDRAYADGAPAVIQSLFVFAEVNQVMIEGKGIRILVSPPPEDIRTWAKDMGDVLRAGLTPGEVLDVPTANKSTVKGATSAFAQRNPTPETMAIQKLLDAEINPGIVAHGGKIEVFEMRGNDLYVSMQGGCVGCRSAQMTLKEGVEKKIRAHFPNVEKIIDVTDHSQGENPYFK